jgi:carboxymethylenebutenolidase
MGARFALHAASAASDQFVAAACIHPGALVTERTDSPHHELAGVRGELYVAFAETDRSATREVVERLREELERQGVASVVERLPGTAHGFAIRPSLRPSAAELVLLARLIARDRRRVA